LCRSFWLRSVRVNLSDPATFKEKHHENRRTGRSFRDRRGDAKWKSVDPRWRDLALKPSTEGEGTRRLLDLGAQRLDAMDEAGIDVAVLSLTTPGVQNLDAEVAVDLAQSSNDHLAAAVHTAPERFQGFATLPTPSPDRAAKELERCIQELSLHGAMLHGRTRDRNLSEQEFWPIFEAAEALRAPLYLHPQSPQQGVLDAYYRGFGEEIDSLFACPGIGWMPQD